MPAVAPMAAVLIALLALLLIYALEVFGKALAHLLPSFVPGIPGLNPRSWIEAGVGLLQSAIRWIIGDVIRPAIGLFARPVIAVFGWIASIERFVVTAATEVGWIVNVAVPEALDAAKAYALRWARAAEAYAASLYHRAIAYVVEKYHAAIAYAHQLYVAAEHYAARKVAALESTALHWYHLATAAAAAAITTAETFTKTYTHALTASLQASIDAVRATVTSELAVAERYADTAVADLSRAVQDSIGTAVAGVITVVDVDSIAGLASAWPGLIDDVDALAGVIATDLPDIGAAVRAIPRAIPTDLAAALTAVGAISIPMLRYMARCGVPNCRNLSQLGRDLSELAGAIEAGAFLALLVGLAADPIGTAHWLSDNVGGLASDAVHDARSLLGV